MRNKKSFYILNQILLLIMVLFFGCVKEELDFSNISDEFEYKPELHIPLVIGSLKLYDLIEDAIDDSTVLHGTDSSIIVYIKQDSVYYFEPLDLVDIPDQGTQDYDINSFPVAYSHPHDTTIIFTKIDSFRFQFNNNMRLDSAILNVGQLDIEVTSTFNLANNLIITVPNFHYPADPFEETLNIPAASSGTPYNQMYSYPLANSKIVIDNSDPDSSFLMIIMNVAVFLPAGNTITANSSIQVQYTFSDLDGFEAIFGYFGDTTYTFDTVFNVEIDMIDQLTGTFTVTNPTINLNINHSFGFPFEYDMRLRGYFNNGDSTILDPDPQIINYSGNYLLPNATDAITIDASTPGIDNFFVFPSPTQIGVNAMLAFNPTGVTNTNYILEDSRMLIDLEVEVPLEFRADVQFTDTLELDLGNLDSVDYIEYAALYYSFWNYFPISLSPTLYLYDTINAQIVDTIYLNKFGHFLIKAAPVDNAGVTISSAVTEEKGMVELTSTEIENLFTPQNKMIIVAAIETYNFGTVPSVKILSSNSLNFKINLETRFNINNNTVKK